MTYDPEAAERLVAILTPLITEQSCGEWDDKTINEDVQMFLPPLLTALQEARNAALREAADLCVEYSTHHGTGMFDKHSHACSEAILALIDTPAPPAEPAGGARPDEDWPDIPDTPEDRAYRKGWNEGVTAGKSFTVVSDPSQPDADKREALVTALEEAYQQWLDRKDDGDQWFWHSQADALLAAGWTHKREEG